MRRRDFIKGVGGSAVAWPLAAQAQQTASPRHIGVLLVGLTPESKPAQSFLQGLRDAGYSVGRDVVIEWRLAHGDYDRVPDLVADLVRNKVDVMVMDSTIGTEAAMRATSTIPIVMALVVDPVGSGLVKSLARPGGNVTGLSMMTSDLNPKRLQMLKDIVPGLTHVAVLWNPDHPFHHQIIKELKAVAPSLSITLTFEGVQTDDDLGQRFADIRRVGAQAVYVVEDPFFFSARVQLLKLTSEARLGTIHELRRWPEEGALMSYGPVLDDLFRRAAIYVDRIFKGANTADLPVEQPTKFEFVINLKTAKALGLTIPSGVFAIADDLIQ
jgi:putative tryptophan/tyrosine transport system substrate-binding protein